MAAIVLSLVSGKYLLVSPVYHFDSFFSDLSVMFLAQFDALSWSNPSYWVSLFLVATLLPIFLYLYTTWAKLRQIPGPFLARFTDFPRLFWVWSRKAHEIHIDLHAKYGKLVRFGPNMVSVGDPSEISNIYKMHTPLLKVCHTSETVVIPNDVDVQ